MQFCIFVINIASRDTWTDPKDIPDSSMIPFQEPLRLDKPPPTAIITAVILRFGYRGTFRFGNGLYNPQPNWNFDFGHCVIICHRECDISCDTIGLTLSNVTIEPKLAHFWVHCILKLISVQKTGRRNCCEGKSEIKSKGR